MLFNIISCAWACFVIVRTCYTAIKKKMTMLLDYIVRFVIIILIRVLPSPWPFAISTVLAVSSAVGCFGMLTMKIFSNLYKLAGLRKVDVHSKEYNNDIIAFGLRMLVYIALAVTIKLEV